MADSQRVVPSDTAGKLRLVKQLLEDAVFAKLEAAQPSKEVAPALFAGEANALWRDVLATSLNGCLLYTSDAADE